MRHRRQSGFALLLIFAMMSAAAVMVYMQLPRFVMQSQRGKEQLLIDRGEQYQRAIQLYYRKLKTWPQSLDDLEKGNNMRFLRRKYKDPFTGKAEWRIVHMANGVYTDSLVYNNEKQKEKAQVFVAEQASIGTDPNSDQAQDGKNLALQQRPSDRTNNPLDDLPASLRAFVYPGAVAPRDQQRPRNLEEDVQYANGATAPTAGVYGIGAVPMSGFTPPPIDPNQPREVQASVQNGAGGLTFEEIQRRAAEAMANAGNNAGLIGQSIPGGGNSFVGGSSNSDAYVPGPVPGAIGLPYSAIANQNGAPLTNSNGAPPIPGTNMPNGFPGTGVPQAPPYGAPSPGNTGSSFIGGGNTYNSNQPAPGFGAAATGFGSNGVSGYSASSSQPFPGGGATPGVGATSPAAAQMLNNLLTQPRQASGAPAGTVAGGSGIVGVASKYRGESVKVYREKTNFRLWEFIYDPAKDTSGQKPGGGQNGNAPPLPGGLPGGTNPTSGMLPGGTPPPRTPNNPNAPPTFAPGGRAPTPNTGFGPTIPTPSSGSSGGSFIGGPAAPIGGSAAPVGPTGSTPGSSNGNRTNVPPPATQPPGNSPFIGGR